MDLQELGLVDYQVRSIGWKRTQYDGIRKAKNKVVRYSLFSGFFSKKRSERYDREKTIRYLLQDIGCEVYGGALLDIHASDTAEITKLADTRNNLSDSGEPK